MNTRQQVIKYISDNSVTLAQVKSMTQAQFNNALNVNLTVAHIKNIMRPIITTMQRAENNSKLQGLKTQAKTWVQNNISQDAEFEFVHRKRQIIIWLDGKPEVEEIE